MVKGKRKFHTTQKSYAAALDSKLLGTADCYHRYTPVPADLRAVHHRVQALNEKTFKPGKNISSLPLQNIEGPTSPPAWWSPKPDNFCTPHADLAVLRECHSRDDMGDVGRAWMGGLLASGWHHLCVRYKFHNEDVAWYVPLHHLPGSAVLAWPVTLHSCAPLGGKLLVEFADNISSPSVLPIVQLSDCLSFSWQWRSPEGQRRAGIEPGWLLGKKGLLAVQSSEQDGVMRTAARKAWYDLDAAYIQKVCGATGYALGLPAAASLFEVILAATKRVLAVDDDEALEICWTRIVRIRARRTHSKQLLQVDEAMDVIEPNDAKDIKQQQEKSEKQKIDTKLFSQEYRLKRRAVPNKRLGGTKANPKGKVKCHSKLPANFSELLHKDVRPFSPPDANVWKSNSTGAWIGRLHPAGCTSRSWDKYTDVGALRLVLVSLWQQWCDRSGLQYSECPLQGLLDDEEALKAACAGP